MYAKDAHAADAPGAGGKYVRESFCPMDHGDGAARLRGLGEGFDPCVNRVDRNTRSASLVQRRAHRSGVEVGWIGERDVVSVLVRWIERETIPSK